MVHSATRLPTVIVCCLWISLRPPSPHPPLFSFLDILMHVAFSALVVIVFSKGDRKGGELVRKGQEHIKNYKTLRSKSYHHFHFSDPFFFFFLHLFVGMARVLPWSKEVSTPLPPQRRSSMKSDDPPSIALPVHTSNAHSNSATTPQSKDSSPVTKTIPNIPPPLPPPRAVSPAVLELPSAQSTVYEVNDKDVQLSPMSKRAPFPSPSKFPPKGNKNGSGESPTLWTPSEANHDDDDIIPPLPEKMSKTITSPSTNTNSFEDDPDVSLSKGLF